MGLTFTSSYKPQSIMVPICSYSNELKKIILDILLVLLSHKYTLSED